MLREAPCPRTWGDWEARQNDIGMHYFVNKKTLAAVMEEPLGWGWAGEWDVSARSWVYLHTGTHEVRAELPDGVPHGSCYISKRSRGIVWHPPPTSHPFGEYVENPLILFHRFPPETTPTTQPHPLAWHQWIACLSKRTKHWFYHDTETTTSTWHRPEGWGTVSPVVSPAPSPTPSASEEAQTEQTEQTEDASQSSMLSAARTVSNTTVDVVQTKQSGSSISAASAATLSLRVRNAASSQQEEAAVMAEWLRTEGEKAAFLVDSGDFGRPVTKAGIVRAWAAVASSETHEIYAAWHNSINMGHIEVLWYDVDDDMAWCHWAGVPRYAMLAYVYVLPCFRKRRLGTVMVTRACQRAFANGAHKIVLLLQETNTPLIRFYCRIGFEVNPDQRFFRGDETLLMLELKEMPEV